MDALRRWFGLVRETIEHHHHVEDGQLWPELDRRRPGFLADAAALIEDHQQLDDAFDGVERSLARLTRAADALATAVAVRAATDLHVLLVGHLDREEATVLGPIGAAFTAEEYAHFEHDAARGTPFRLFAFGLPWLLDGVDDAARRAVLDPMPRLARLMYRPFRWWYRRIAAPLHPH